MKMINYKLASLAEQEEGIRQSLFEFTAVEAQKLSAIFQAWMDKHSENIEYLSEQFYSKKNNTLNFRDVLYELFFDESRDYDNHKWRVDNLK